MGNVGTRASLSLCCYEQGQGCVEVRPHVISGGGGDVHFQAARLDGRGCVGKCPRGAGQMLAFLRTKQSLLLRACGSE